MDVNDPLLLWLVSPEGRHAAERVASKRGLVAALVDDLVSDASSRALAFLRRGERADVPSAFGRRLLNFAALDLLRGRRPFVAPAASIDDEGFAEPGDPGVDVEASAIGGGGGDSVREQLRGALLAGGRTVAAALTYLAVAVEGARPNVSCPQPGQGAGPVEGAEWVGLWYSGHDDCFTSPVHPDGAALRKRRSRAVQKLRSTLIAAAERAGVAEEGHDG